MITDDALNIVGSRERSVEEGRWYQGDIDVSGDVNDRNAVLYRWQRWPRGKVFYRLDDTYTQDQVANINEAFREFHLKTCIRFIPMKHKRKTFVDIRDEAGCSSHVGYDGRMHVTRLHAPGCVQRAGTVMHELMHTLGFHHEHARADRDLYVTINWTNIVPGHEKNFDKLPRELS